MALTARNAIAIGLCERKIIRVKLLTPFEFDDTQEDMFKKSSNYKCR